QLHGSLLNMRRVVSRIWGALFRASLETKHINPAVPNQPAAMDGHDGSAEVCLHPTFLPDWPN
ncbi:hypothetical protein, partial [Xanthomonas vasicola]